MARITVRPFIPVLWCFTLLALSLCAIIILSLLGLAYTLDSPQVAYGMSKSDAHHHARSCYVAAAIYMALAVLSSFQLYLHHRQTHGNAPFPVHVTVVGGDKHDDHLYAGAHEADSSRGKEQRGTTRLRGVQGSEHIELREMSG